jgi:uncharacterized protein (TIRG00374 family)
MKVRFSWWWLIWLAIPLLLYLALRDIGWAAVWAAVARLSLGQVFGLAALSGVILAAFGLRWWLIMRALGHTLPWTALTLYRVASFGVSYYTPGPQFGGEPLQVYLLSRRHGIPAALGAAGTALDKTLELLVNFVFLAVGLGVSLEFGGLPGLPREAATVLIVVLIGLPTAYLGALALGWRPIHALARTLPVRAAAYTRFVASADEAERAMTQFVRTQPTAFSLALLVSVLSWGLMLFEFWVSLAWLGLTLGPWQLIIALTINRFAFLAPLPGGLGALEAGQVLAMTAIGQPPTIGVSQGLVIRLRDVLIGAAGLWLATALARGRSVEERL